MKYLALTLAILICSCKKTTKADEAPLAEIAGGKGGSFHIAVFPVKGTKGISGKVYIKYGTKTVTSSYNQYNDSSATMVEPGFGPHAHFLSLKPGFYAVAAYGMDGSKRLSNDTIIEIKSTQGPSTDYDLQLK